MLYVLDWYVVCTGLVCCMYWTGVLYVLDWPYQYNTPAQYIQHISPIQHTSPVLNTLYALCCMYSTGMLYEGGGGGALPLHLYQRGRVVVRSTRHQCTILRFLGDILPHPHTYAHAHKLLPSSEALEKPWVYMKPCV